jgi:hypothetical protein
MNSSIDNEQPPKSPVLGGNNIKRSHTTMQLPKFETVKEDYPDDKSVGPFGDNVSHAGSRSSQIGKRAAKYTKKTEHSPVNTRKTMEALPVPEDSGMILKMLFRPQKFGNGTLFDYTCQGGNWNIVPDVVS